MLTRNKHLRAHQEFALACRALGLPAVRCAGGKLDGKTLPGLALCIRRTERLRLDETMALLEADPCEGLPVLAHRKNRRPWRVTMRLDVFLTLYQAFLQSLPPEIPQTSAPAAAD